MRENRTIRFRGKDRENWHYGDLVQEIRHNDNKLFEGIITHIRNFEYKNGDYVGYTFPVKSETIGQFTGLYDKNGKEIYEGDIVYWESAKKNYKVIFVDGGYCLDTPGFATDLYRCEDSKGNHLKIVGNIYDNKELLEE